MTSFHPSSSLLDQDSDALRAEGYGADVIAAVETERAIQIGRAMARLAELIPTEDALKALYSSIVADAEKAPNAQGRDVFTPRGMVELHHSVLSAVEEFEDDRDDSIERAERAAGA